MSACRAMSFFESLSRATTLDFCPAEDHHPGRGHGELAAAKFMEFDDRPPPR